AQAKAEYPMVEIAHLNAVVAAQRAAAALEDAMQRPLLPGPAVLAGAAVSAVTR
ncbi:MAG TPA: TolC family protein, partial [Casimicrobiaceae bacterium]|nr:TolC family protein [Casimicrobiaceae bacterium]